MCTPSLRHLSKLVKFVLKHSQMTELEKELEKDGFFFSHVLGWRESGLKKKERERERERGRELKCAQEQASLIHSPPTGQGKGTPL